MNKIAIIDDNMVFRKVTKMFLKKLDVFEDDILLFQNGLEIYDYVKDNIENANALPKILFLDLNMPVMDGWEFLNLFQIFTEKYHYNPEIYILTSSVDNKDYDTAMHMGNVKGYLIKPVSLNALDKIIKN